MSHNHNPTKRARMAREMKRTTYVPRPQFMERGPDGVPRRVTGLIPSEVVRLVALLDTGKTATQIRGEQWMFRDGVRRTLNPKAIRELRASHVAGLDETALLVRMLDEQEQMGAWAP